MKNTPSEQPEVSETQEHNEFTQKVAALNDELRIYGLGGRVMVTQGIDALDAATQLQVMQAVQQFSDFHPDNDPYGEHDFGSVTVQGMTVFWKIDYYDKNYQMLSPDKSDPAVTNRVLTIMHASEY